MLSAADIHVLHAETLPLEDNLDYIISLCSDDPWLILHPAINWWAMKHAGDIRKYVEGNSKHYQEGAARRYQRFRDKLKNAKP